MKNFITSLLGSLVALVVFSTLSVLLLLGFIGALVALSQQKKVTVVEPGSYLVLDLNEAITDAPPSIDFGDLGGGRADTLQLRQVTRALRHAAHDSNIKGVLLLGNVSASGLGSGYAALREVRAALIDFRNSGKPIEAYLESADKKDYYLASVATDLCLDPYGLILLPGLASEPMFYAGAFEKYGVGVQVTRVGKYKSYVEPFTRTDMSPENREQLQKLLDDIWGSLLADIARSRNTTVAALQATVDAEGLIRPEIAVKSHMVDRLAYRDEVIDKLKKATGVDSPTASFKQIDLASYARSALKASTGANQVAVLYAEGDIVNGEGDTKEIGATRFAREIRRLRQDSSVKAIVLRVNSPGGSATAAETIQRELRLARAAKPVVVSMGSYAASGGYWISAYGDRIFAEPTTITGSIGVFGIQFDVKKLANDHGITFDSVKTGKFADAITISRPKTDEEIAVFQRIVDWIYGQFIDKVAEGRKLKKADVEEIAQGRVWSGQQAKKLGLVDEIGGLDAAIHFAAQEAKLGENYRVAEYPATKAFAEALAELLGKYGPASLHVSESSLAGQISERVTSEIRHLESFDDPRGVYARMPLDLAIH